MESNPLSPTGKRLLDHIEHAEQLAEQPRGDTFHVSGVAGGVYFAYEQLRNAANYTQQHLLLRAAIERYLHRAVYLPDKTAPKIADDLIVELTQARYLKNDSIPQTALRGINSLVAQYARFYTALTGQHNVPRAKASRWVYQTLSVAIERLIMPQTRIDAVIDTAYHHYLETIDSAAYSQADPYAFNAALYCALHRSLIKSDAATTRYYWLMTQSDQTVRPQGFIAACETIDMWFESPLTNKLVRVINKYGAPMRSLRELVVRHNASTDLLNDKPRLLAKLENVVVEQYDAIHSTTLTNLWRMVVFVALTKMLIGIAIEIPYDLFVYGSIAVVPLVLNLAFPPLYMATALFGIRRPGPGNTDTILSYAERILYETDKPLKYGMQKRPISGNLKTWFNVAYGITFLIPFALLVWGLIALGFGLVHGLIFFMFLSGVSFFRWRLIQAAREMDIIDRPQSLLTAIANFFHMPFVQLGHWLSDRYRQVNVITFILDIAIELPLKTSLRILRQWVSFVTDKHDQL
ncbi:MAG TPA: hypothetical protein VJM32_00825 [Candidatus Saccharimonadales bacterium]|nr:hypothetical protein [Candidatus Saccharimonadales bacterium]